MQILREIFLSFRNCNSLGDHRSYVKHFVFGEVFVGVSDDEGSNFLRDLGSSGLYCHGIVFQVVIFCSWIGIKAEILSLDICIHLQNGVWKALCCIGITIWGFRTSFSGINFFFLLFYSLMTFIFWSLMESYYVKGIRDLQAYRQSCWRIVCQVKTQDPENFVEEVKSLVTAWLMDAQPNG